MKKRADETSVCARPFPADETFMGIHVKVCCSRVNQRSERICHAAELYLEAFYWKRFTSRYNQVCLCRPPARRPSPHSDLQGETWSPSIQDMNMYAVPSPGIPGCPPGLEYLAQVDQLLIKQKVEVIEALVGFESNNKYEVRNVMGQNVFYAVEENDCLSRQCCGPLRPFNIHILDNFGQEVISITRPLKCMSCFFPCCLQELEVQAPPGNTVGYVIQQWHPLSPKFIVANEHNEPVLKIHGPFCGWSCLPDVDFEILTMDEVSKIGKISKQWTGLLREAFTDADNFGIQFPMDLDVRMKAVMIGACFLIDFMFFETPN
ncbi:Phospholipid scramblase 1 [Crenichthys baileyi]|uniref:Phospholipid scramblase n=1 Tax=Crenichthys baileyi TaxID=28760 RepID=A0AAV9QZ04_9TELE